MSQPHFWLNGKLVNREEARVDMLANGLHYGTGVFEGIRCYDTGGKAGIFQLAGLTDRALKSYTKGLGRYPDRIDTHLLVANLMRETGNEMEAARRFQYLAATAERDDLFTIAIDGILNLRAQQQSQVSNQLVEWAMRVTLERLAARSHRFYLHRLAADLAEDVLLKGGTFPVHMSHVESVLAPPDGAMILGETDIEPNAVLRFGPRQWGVQFHPEFDADIMRRYVEARREIIRGEGSDPEAMIAAAAETPESTLILNRFAMLVG